MSYKIDMIKTEDENLFEVVNTWNDEYIGFIINRTVENGPFDPDWYFYPDDNDIRVCTIYGKTPGCCMMKFFGSGNLDVTFKEKENG